MDIRHAPGRGAKALTVGVAFLLALAGAAAGAAAEPPGPAGWLFDPSEVVVVDLTLSPQALADLEAAPDEYVEGTFSLSSADGPPGGAETPVGSPLTVGVRLVGSAPGSFRPLPGKAAFEIEFDEFVGGQTFEGLKRLILDNMVEDRSQIHETLTYEVFRAMGIAAPRTGYADVRVNGEEYGMHLNVEPVDALALERWFGPFGDPQHLYEGEDGDDVEPGKAAEFEVDEGEEVERGDLEALIDAVNAEGPEAWSAQVASVADLDEMTRMWAVERYLGRWDGYAGQPGSSLRPNGYFLFSDPVGRFQMLPWGSDQTLEEHLEFDAPASGLMFNRCLADPGCEASYAQGLREVGDVVPGLGLDGRAAALAAELAPWQELETAPRREYAASEIEAGVADARAFIASRAAELSAWLSSTTDQGGGDAAAGAAEVANAAAGSGSPAVPTPARLRIDSALSPKRVLRSSLHLPGAGNVSQVVTIATAKGRLRVCAAHARVSQPGTLTLRCRLTPQVRRRLRRRPLRLLVVTRFDPVDGPAETLQRRVRVPRLGGKQGA